MPFTAAYPNPRTGDVNRDVDSLRDNLIAFLDEINHALENINSRTIKGDLQQAKIEAGQITTNKARINDAQIANLVADKIKAGTLDLSKGITIKGGGDISTYIDDHCIVMEAGGNKRVYVGMDDRKTVTDDSGKKVNNPNYGKFVFLLQDSSGTRGIVMTDDGNATFTGTINASTINGGAINGVNIDTLQDVKVGRNLYLRAKNVDGTAGDTAGIIIYNAKGEEIGHINVTEGGSNTPSLNVNCVNDVLVSNGKSYVHLKSNEVTVNATTDVVVRGNKVRLGSTSDGLNNIQMNGEAVATQKWVQEYIKTILGG